MTRRRFAIVLLVFLPLLGCGRRSNGDADRALQAVRSEGLRTTGMPLPGGLPPYAIIPLDSFVTATNAGDQAGNRFIEFSTSLSPATVLLFYQKAAAEAGLVQRKHNAPATWVSGNGKVALTVGVQPIQGVGSVVRLTFH